MINFYENIFSYTIIPLFLIRQYFSKQFIIEEITKIKGFMKLLMKRRNTGIEWTKYELAKIKIHLRRVSKVIPIFVIFLFPGGLLLLGLLALYLDRRKRRRRI